MVLVIIVIALGVMLYLDYQEKNKLNSIITGLEQEKNDLVSQVEDLTLKHKNFTDCYINGIDSKNKCLCSKKFKHHSSYYRHKKVCNFIPILQKSNNVQTNNDIIQILINENKELRNMVLEVCNKIQEKL